MSMHEVDSGSSAPKHFAAEELSFAHQVRIALASFGGSPVRNRVLLLAAALLAVIVLTAYGQIALNRWNVPFYNALERRDGAEFLRQLGVFAVIAGCLLVLNVIQTWLNQMTALTMREGLSRDIVDQWLKGRRGYRLSLGSPLGVNPDQRLHEDARKLAEMTASLSIGLVQATILLASFVGVLWQLSNDFSFHLGDRTISVPGYMVWAALAYAALASLFSQLVGFRLIGLNAERYAREAELRTSLMRVNENLEAIALANGQETERRHVHDRINTVVASIRQLAIALTNLTWVTAGFGWLAIIVPTLVASPAYFAGDLSFGGLMMAAAAFTQVYAALRWYVDNYGAIADWRATLYRVMVFRAALTELDKTTAGGAIRLRAGPPGRLTLLDLEINARTNGDGHKTLLGFDESENTVSFGEKVMIDGDPGVNRKLLFDAIAGLWASGAGDIMLPGEEEVLFVPQIHYLPEGKLRSVLAYPLASAGFADADMAAALAAVGLARLAPMLDEHARWDRVLDEDEQMALAFAGLLLRRPRWIIFNDVLEGLEPETVKHLAEAMRLMKGATMVYVGRSEAFMQAFSPRLIHLRLL